MAEKRKKKEEEKLGWQKSVLLYAHDMLYLLLIVMLLFLLVFRIIVVSGGSMRMTLLDGDYLLLLNNTFYHTPQRGDIVVISKESFDNGKPIVKRVIATEGQTVDIDFETGEVSVDGTVLQEYLANTIETAKQNEQITTEQRDSLWSLTDQYVYKNADLLQNYFTDRGEVVSSDYILNNIELEGAGDKAQTTYDGLVLKLVSLEQQVASSQIDRQFQEEILQSFRNVDFGGTSEQHAAMESMINDYEAQLKSYYEIINTSSKELNLYISADYLKMISSVQVAAAINVKLYLMLALVLFFVIGCCGAILLGRISDAVDYLLYVDKKTGLPNREKLNVYITGMADRILPEDYTCFALQLDNLTEMSRRFGYHVGDGILKDFSGLLQLMGDTDGTVGYNGAGKFLAFFDECSTRKAEVMIRILQSQVDEYNKLNPEYPILFTAAWATASEEKLYHVRDLVRCAQKKMALIAEEGGAVLAGTERGEA